MLLPWMLRVAGAWGRITPNRLGLGAPKPAPVPVPVPVRTTRRR